MAKLWCHLNWISICYLVCMSVYLLSALYSQPQLKYTGFKQNNRNAVLLTLSISLSDGEKKVFRFEWQANILCIKITNQCITYNSFIPEVKCFEIANLTCEHILSVSFCAWITMNVTWLRFPAKSIEPKTHFENITEKQSVAVFFLRKSLASSTCPIPSSSIISVQFCFVLLKVWSIHNFMLFFGFTCLFARHASSLFFSPSF